MSTDSLSHLAMIKGDSRLELESAGASLLGNASSSPPGSCLAWRGPSWQAMQPRSPGGQGEGMVRGRQLPPQAQARELGQSRASLLASSSPPHSWFSSSLLPCPPRLTKGNSGDPPPPTPPQPRRRRAEGEQQLAKLETHTQRKNSQQTPGLCSGGLRVLFEATLGQPGLLPTSGHPAPCSFHIPEICS